MAGCRKLSMVSKLFEMAVRVGGIDEARWSKWQTISKGAHEAPRQSKNSRHVQLQLRACYK